MVPLFVVVAPDARTGKTYLVNLIGLIATGTIPVRNAGAKNPEEFEKRVETAALAGRAVFHLNNLPRGMVVDSERLQELCTEGLVNIRKLGKHEEGDCDCRATTAFLNGNNILLAADLVPRSVTCQLDARSEHPEERTFKTNPMNVVRAGRGKYLAAAITILRAWHFARQEDVTHVQGKKHKRVAGFEQWSKVVQQAMIWLDMEDPMGKMEEMRAADPTEENLVDLIDAVALAFRRELKEVNSKLQRVFNVRECKDLAQSNPKLEEMMLFHGRPNDKHFATLLMNARDKIRNGLCIRLAVKDDKRGRIALKALPKLLQRLKIATHSSGST
jgi:putative DNA primase/helicase